MPGAIAFLDILGYQSFLANNSASESTDAALEVLEMITALPKRVQAELSENWAQEAFGQSVIQSLHHVIFSDTIVLLIPYAKKDPGACLTYLTVSAGLLTAKLFDEGLPIRGAIAEGPFIVKDTCFAGKGIVDAYRLCSQLDFSGLVLSHECAERLRRPESAPWVADYLVHILSPLKDRPEDRLYHVNYMRHFGGALQKHLDRDLIDCVMSRFWAHGKDCPTSLDGKIRNTCKMMRKLRFAVNPPTIAKKTSADTIAD
jgi:hypothetical protein